MCVLFCHELLQPQLGTYEPQDLQSTPSHHTPPPHPSNPDLYLPDTDPRYTHPQHPTPLHAIDQTSYPDQLKSISQQPHSDYPYQHPPSHQARESNSSSQSYHSTSYDPSHLSRSAPSHLHYPLQPSHTEHTHYLHSDVLLSRPGPMEPHHRLPNPADFARHAPPNASSGHSSPHLRHLGAASEALEEQRQVEDPESHLSRSRRGSHHQSRPASHLFNSHHYSHDDLVRHSHEVSNPHPHPHHRTHRHAFQPYSHASSTNVSVANSPVSSHSELSDDDQPSRYPPRPFHFTPSTSPVLGPMRSLSLFHGRSTQATSAAPSATPSPHRHISRPSSPAQLPPFRLSAPLMPVPNPSNISASQEDVEMQGSEPGLERATSSSSSFTPSYPTQPPQAWGSTSQAPEPIAGSSSAASSMYDYSHRPSSVHASSAPSSVIESETTRRKGGLEDLLTTDTPVHARPLTLPPLSAITKNCSSTYRPPSIGTSVEGTTSAFFKSRSAPSSRVNSPPGSPIRLAPPLLSRSTSLTKSAFSQPLSSSPPPPSTRTTTSSSSSSRRRNHSGSSVPRRKNKLGLQMTPIDRTHVGVSSSSAGLGGMRYDEDVLDDGHQIVGDPSSILMIHQRDRRLSRTGSFSSCTSNSSSRSR